MIQLDIVLKMGDCEKQMTMDEARNLYSELNRLFNNGTNVQTQRLDLPPAPPAPAMNTEHPQVTAAKEAAAKRTGGCGGGCGGNKKKEQVDEVKPKRVSTRRVSIKEKDK